MTAELPMSPPRLTRVLEAFVRHEIDFVVVGGMAGLAHGSSHLTLDIDLAYSRDRANIRRLVGALSEIGVRLRGAPPELPFILEERTIENGANFTFATPLGDLDLLADIAGIRSYEALKNGSEAKTIAGHRVRVASLDHLIAMKRAADRPKDKAMLEEYLVIAEEQRKLAD